MKALHEVWFGMVDEDAARRVVRVRLLLNRAHATLDVESHLPHIRCIMTAPSNRSAALLR